MNTSRTPFAMLLALATFACAGCDKSTPASPDAAADTKADTLTTPDAPSVDAPSVDAPSLDIPTTPDPGPAEVSIDSSDDGSEDAAAEVDAGPPPECDAANASVKCNDFKSCTEDLCVAGQCENPPIPGCCTADEQCDDGIECTVDSCNVIKKECLNLKGSNLCCLDAADCDDGEACTADLCASNQCVTPNICECNSNVDCMDGNDCTEDTCVGSACVYTALSTAGCCAEASDCDDGDDATFDDCQESICWNVALPCGTDADCGSADACVVGTCSTAGTCAFGPVAWDGCCQLASECDDGHATTTDACVANQCVHTVGAGPGVTCPTDSECATPNSCVVTACAAQAGQCSAAPVEGANCCDMVADCAVPADYCQAATCEAFACGTAALTGEQAFWTEGFDGVAALDSWTVVDDGKAAKWQVGTAQATSAPASLYYGALPAMNYDVGTTTGTATSGEITPPAGASALTLKFWVSGDIEPISSRDLLEVSVVQSGVETKVWSKSESAGLGTGWSEFTADLTGTVTGPFAVLVRFDSVDEVNNTGEGVYIDDVRVLAPCSQ